MKKHLLVFDVDWWVLGKHAQLIKKHHTNLEIMSIDEVHEQLTLLGSESLNNRFEIISTMCLGLAQMLISNGIRVDSSAAVSHYYFMQNHHTFREWADQPILSHSFITEYLSKIKAIGAINSNLAKLLSNLSPNSNVKYIKQFVDTDHFIPYEKKSNSDEFIIGWVGDTEKTCKNYYTTYLQIVEAFKNHPQVRFSEATMKSFIPSNEMPAFYNNLDLLIITGNHEGGPAPVLEAYACGVPVLSTNIGYVKDVTPFDIHHLILNTNDPNCFIDKINELLGAKNELKDIGKKVRKYVNENFSLNQAIQDWVKHLFYFDQMPIQLSYDKEESLKERNPTKKIFTNIYSNNLWGSSESVSGSGSTLFQTRTIIEELSFLIKRLQIKTLLDAPCGDFHWMKEVRSNLDLYTGVDIVSELIEENNKKYSAYNRRFLNLNILQDSLPKADLILCRDCLVHLSFDDIQSAIINFKKSKSKYLLTTTFTNVSQNIDIKTGEWRPLNLEIYPFNFIEPILVINENCTEGNMAYTDKSLALWDLDKIII
ncbi:glycosyltransferase [Priestia aryabhattai]|uniref:glycosyltransferase n=1 Tax=Priestia aryabhattai TaxID=412384 RepID=UPI0009BF4B1D|nr:glycosyltransferase [Priestia aryabhattai]